MNNKTVLQIFGLFIFTSLNYFNCLGANIYLSILSENQVLYLFSTLAQIVGALLGITIAGYSILDSQLESAGKKDTTLTKFSDSLRADCFLTFKIIIISSIADILICLLILGNYDISFGSLKLFFMSEAIIIFIFTLIIIFDFVSYLDPSRFNQKGSQEKEELEKNQPEPSSTNPPNISISFALFVTDYNLLEDTIRKFAQEKLSCDHQFSNLHTPDALNILLKNNIISAYTYNNINELRLYRNALVHSLDRDKSVDFNFYDNLQKTKKLLESMYENRKNDNLFISAKKELDNYSEKRGLGKIEKLILAFLTHNTATMYEITQALNLSRSTAHVKILSLVEMGLVISIKNGKKILYTKNEV